MPKLILTLLLFICTPLTMIGQDLLCNVQVLSPQIQGSDKQVFETLEQTIREFMNNRKWADDVFSNEERIECNLVINITSRPSVNEFKATAQIQTSRPVFNTSYNTTLLNFTDEDWSFKYAELEPIEFSESGSNPNLAAMLAFYAYTIIGMDYDSYSLEGGSPYFQKAQNIVNNAQQTNSPGWKAFEGNRNRYWVLENMLNPQFKPYRQGIYEYHRLGLDLLYDDLEKGRQSMFNAITQMNKVSKGKPGAFLLQLFFTAKSDEIVSAFTEAAADIQQRIVPILIQTDPTNLTKYQNITQN
ncbi:MAG: hypothetical protein ACJATA_000362 [Sphingobacteriales bacterium]|jgi:hypothetical protein